MKKNKELVEFGLYFAKIRETSGFRTKTELADASGVAVSTISRIESGTNKVQPDTLKVLAPFLKGISYDELMKRAGYIKEESKADDTDPGYQVFHRAKKELSPEAYNEWLKFVERAKKAFKDGNGDD